MHCNSSFTRNCLVLGTALLWLSVFGCGGGGSGGGGGGGGGGVVAGPTAKFTFPAGDTTTDAEELIITGTAADPDGVASLSMNGVSANTTDGFQTWSALITLDPGMNVIRVQAENSAGTQNSSATEITIENIPPLVTTFDVTVDSDDGLAYAVDPVGRTLSRIDLSSRVRTILSDDDHGIGSEFSNPVAVAVDTSSGEVLVLDGTPAALFGVDPVTGDRRVISNSTTGSGPTLGRPVDVVYDFNQGNEAIVLDTAPSRLVKVDLNTGNRSNLTEGFFSIPTALEISDNGDSVLVAENRQMNGPLIFRIRLSDGKPLGVISGSGTGMGPDFEDIQAVSPFPGGTVRTRQEAGGALDETL